MPSQKPTPTRPWPVETLVKPKYWMGDIPTVCDLDQNHPITTKFIDGKTSHGPWGNMCPECHKRFGFGLGTGKGQEYTKTEVDGVTRWLKTGG